MREKIEEELAKLMANIDLNMDFDNSQIFGTNFTRFKQEMA